MPNPNLMQSAGQQLLGMDDRANQINQMTAGLFGDGKQLQAPPPQQPAPYDFSQNEDFRRAQGHWDQGVTGQDVMGSIARFGMPVKMQGSDQWVDQNSLINRIIMKMWQQVYTKEFGDDSWKDARMQPQASAQQLKFHNLPEEERDPRFQRPQANRLNRSLGHT